MNLTAKQEQFCQNILLGMNQSQAYRNAYHTQNMARKTVWEKASRLANKGMVGARIQALKRPQELILAEYGVQAATRLVQLVDAREEIVDEQGHVISYRTNTMLNLRAANDVLKYMGYGSRTKQSTIQTELPQISADEVQAMLARLE